MCYEILTKVSFRSNTMLKDLMTIALTWENFIIHIIHTFLADGLVDKFCQRFRSTDDQRQVETLRSQL